MTLRAGVLVGLAAIVQVVLAEDKALPNQAGNSKVSLQGTAYTDRKVITDLLGLDLGEGYVVVKIRVLPETRDALRVSIDDFTLVSRKDGEKSGALAPSAMFGGTALVVGRAKQSGGALGTRNAPVSTVGGPSMPGGGGIGNAGSTESGLAEARVVTSRSADDPRLGPLEAKMLVDQEAKEPVEGLLYFLLERKVKPKDLGMIYSGAGGRLVVDFK